MEAILLFVVKLILSLYLTVTIITFFKVARLLMTEILTSVKERLMNEILPMSNGNVIVSIIICTTVFCLIGIPFIIGYSLYIGISWPTTVISAIRED